MLAVSALTPTVQAICWLAALVLFLIAAFSVPATNPPARVWHRVNLIALGLALGSFVFFWAALARA